MSHTDTRPAQLSAGAVVFRPAGDQLRFLLLRAYCNWDFPKGLVDADEHPLATARREISEETGLEQLRLLPELGYYETKRYARGKVARYYLARAYTSEVSLPVAAELGRPEHHEARWCSLREAHALLVARIQRALSWASAQVDKADGTRRARDD